MRFPTIKDVSADLQSIEKESWYSSVTHEYYDVRLQMDEDGTWRIHVGDASYDTDHRGYWGASSVSTSEAHAKMEGIAYYKGVARDLIDQVKDSYYQSR